MDWGIGLFWTFALIGLVVALLINIDK